MIRRLRCKRPTRHQTDRLPKLVEGPILSREVDQSDVTVSRDSEPGSSGAPFLKVILSYDRDTDPVRDYPFVSPSGVLKKKKLF